MARKQIRSGRKMSKLSKRSTAFPRVQILMPIFFGLSALATVTAFSSLASAFPEVCREIFGEVKSLDLDGDFVNLMNARVNEGLEMSANRASIEEFLKRSVHEKMDPASVAAIDPLTSVGILRSEFGKDDQVVITRAERNEVLLSSADLSKNRSWRIQDISLSPDKKLLVIMTTENGALNKFKFSVMDLKTRQFIKKDIDAVFPRVFWATNSAFYFNPLNVNHHKAFGIFSREVPNEISIKDGIAKGANHWSGIREGTDWIISNLQGQAVKIYGEFGEVVGEDATFIYMKTSGVNGLGEIRRIEKSKLTTYGEAKRIARVIPEPFVRERPDSMILSVDYKSEIFFVKRRWGAKLSWQLLRKDGTEIGTILIPPNLRAVSVSYTGVGRKFKIQLSSAVTESKIFTYDLDTRAWDRDTFEDELLTIDGIKIESEVIDVDSGGTKIPMRIVHRKDLPRDGARPVLIDAYGGFNRAGSIDGDRTPMNNEFLKRGGILAWPALRGGNEFANAWYISGAGTNKMNTMLDLIASARWLSQSGWSNPSRIAITGASNGGFVVASAALLAPDAFGLVMPSAGVMDLRATPELDPAIESDWRFDYGNASVAADQERMTGFSPVELAKKVKPGEKLPKFLVITGLDDDRVNPVHSERFVKALMEKAPSSVEMVGIKNSGHFVYSMTSSHLIGLRVSTIRWTTLFDTFGMKF